MDENKAIEHNEEKYDVTHFGVKGEKQTIFYMVRIG